MHGRDTGQFGIGGGSVTADMRFIGPTLDITTDQGDIKIASCYSDQSKFSTRWGNMVLRNIHNESYITMQGVDGCTNVFMKKGELGIQISHVGNESRLHVEEGDIKLKPTSKGDNSQNLNCHFHLQI